MAFNGSGTFNRLYTWVIDAANGIKIRADRMDAEMNGFATGLTDCVTRDGQSPWLANIPAGGFHITGLGDGTLGSDSVNLSQVQSLKSAFAVAAGTANVLTAAFTPTFVTLTDGMQLNVRALLKNTGAATFAPDAIAAHPITRLGGTALLAGDIAGPLHELILRYNLANTRWELLNPAGVNLPTLAVVGSGTVGGTLDVVGALNKMELVFNGPTPNGAYTDTNVVAAAQAANQDGVTFLLICSGQYGVGASTYAAVYLLRVNATGSGVAGVEIARSDPGGFGPWLLTSLGTGRIGLQAPGIMNNNCLLYRFRS